MITYQTTQCHNSKNHVNKKLNNVHYNVMNIMAAEPKGSRLPILILNQLHACPILYTYAPLSHL